MFTFSWLEAYVMVEDSSEPGISTQRVVSKVERSRPATFMIREIIFNVSIDLSEILQTWFESSSKSILPICKTSATSLKTFAHCSSSIPIFNRYRWILKKSSSVDGFEIRNFSCVYRIKRKFFLYACQITN